MSNRTIGLTATVLLGFWAIAPGWAASIPIENASFESPAMDPGGLPPLPYVEGWIEVDVDTEGSTNTGVFANTPAGSPDHLVNADGNQLAFLDSGQGNALEQDLDATYQVGRDYRLTVAVGVSGRFPPATEEPVDTLELVLYSVDANEVIDVAKETVKAPACSSSKLQDFSVSLPTIRAEDAWAGQSIGIAIRAAGMAGGFWELDNVRLVELSPRSIPIENASFEAPTVPADWLGWPLIESWLETDVDPEGQSRNTGVFPNTEPNSWDHLANAHGEQLAFLGSQEGNALAQDLDATYMPGSIYQLTVAVAISSRYPPSDRLELVLYYRTADEVVDLVVRQIEPVGFVTGYLQDYSLCSPVIRPQDAWAGQPIGVAIRATGMPGLAGGFWDLDNVRLTESWPISNSAEIDEE